jgi:hypothetical protein
MDKLEGKGNFENYDAHVVPVVPANPANPRELNYFPCEPPTLLHPYTGGCAFTKTRPLHQHLPL